MASQKSDIQEAVRVAVSDPSPLTTAALWREIQHLKELFETKTDSIEKAIAVEHEDSVRWPTEIQQQVGNLRELHGERFASVEARFDERDKRFEQEAENSKSAVAAAFNASKEAVAKSEVGFAKQIDGLTEMFRTSVKALESKNDDVKDRLTRLEGKAEGTKETKVEHSDANKWVAALIGLLFTAIMVYLAVRRG